MKSSPENRVRCPLCGGSDYSLRFASRRGPSERASGQRFSCTSPFLASHGDIMRCQQCNMLFSNTQPFQAEILKYYREIEDPLYLEESPAREKTFAPQLRHMKVWVPAPGRLLDVGCYTGVFMKLAAAVGWKVTGLELSSWAAAIARQSGVGEVIEHEITTCGLEPGSFDAITLWDVIEHLADPCALLNKVHELLRPGGIVALSTYMVDSIAARLTGGRYPFFMDMHLVHFSRSTLEHLLKKSGFEIVSWRRHHRVLHLRYLLARLAPMLPGDAVRRICAWLASRNALSQNFVTISFMGLSDVYAKKL